MLLLLFTAPQPVANNRGQLRVRVDASTWAIKPVKIWTGSSWATKPVRYWNGTKWAYTFDTAYTLYEDTSDSGFFIGNGAIEDSGDTGFYTIQGNSVSEDTADSGFFK